MDERNSFSFFHTVRLYCLASVCPPVCFPFSPFWPLVSFNLITLSLLHSIPSCNPQSKSPIQIRESCHTIRIPRHPRKANSVRHCTIYLFVFYSGTSDQTRRIDIALHFPPCYLFPCRIPLLPNFSICLLFVLRSSFLATTPLVVHLAPLCYSWIISQLSYPNQLNVKTKKRNCTTLVLYTNPTRLICLNPKKPTSTN